MRFKHRKTVTAFVYLQTVVLWSYILIQPCFPIWSTKDVSSNLIQNNFVNDFSNETTHRNTIDRNHSHKYVEDIHVSIGDCVGMKLPIHLLQKESWSAADEDKKAFVFSAYVTDQSGTISVVGASIDAGVDVYCQFWHVMSENYTTQLLVKSATLRLLNSGRKYVGAIFECPAANKNATYVSLVSEKCNEPLHLLVIRNGIKSEDYQRKFTTCLKPLHFRYGRAYELVEWIEFNRILGAEKVVVYNYSVAINTARVLEYYVKRGFVELVQWNLPIKSYTWPKTKDPVEIHSIGMLPMLQDCFLRNRPYSEYVVNIDVDELIIPRSDKKTWTEMMSELPTNADTYMFRNTFFRKEWNSSGIVFPNQTLAKQLRMVTLQYFEREDEIWLAGARSKYITKTANVNILRIHDVIGGSTFVVPVNIGLSHHYRNWQKYEDPIKRVVDDTVLRKYGQKLIGKVENAWKEIGDNVPLDIPI